MAFLFSDMLLIADRLRSTKLLNPLLRYKRCFSSMHIIPLSSAVIMDLGSSEEAQQQQQQQPDLSPRPSQPALPTTPLSSPRDKAPLDTVKPDGIDLTGSKKVGNWKGGKERKAKSGGKLQLQYSLHQFELQVLSQDRGVCRCVLGAKSDEEKQMWFHNIEQFTHQKALPKKRGAAGAGAGGAAQSPAEQKKPQQQLQQQEPVHSQPDRPHAEEHNAGKDELQSCTTKRKDDESGWVTAHLSNNGLTQEEVSLLQDETEQLQLRLHPFSSPLEPISNTQLEEEHC